MAPFALLFGGILIGLGILGYTSPGSLGEFDPNKSRMTALIPALVGGLLAICGLIVLAKPEARKHAMHLAALVGVLGFLGGFVPTIRAEFNLNKTSVVTGLIMSGLCLVFVVLCVKSFIAARKARAAS